MKKTIIYILIITLCIPITGCYKKETKKSTNWETILTTTRQNISEEDLNIFKNASKDYKNMSLEVVALLGEQVVAGKNYMFLVKGYKKGKETEATYKIVIIYNNLENKATITTVKDFNYTKYVNKNIESEDESLIGGWYVNSPNNPIKLDKTIQTIFDNATSTLTGFTYTPITVLGKQQTYGTKYAILCYGKASYENTKEAIYLITIHDKPDNTQEITSQAYIDISEYNT